ncbi:TlpA family protein disulfide reductase [Bacteroides sp. AN502(2024)]|uniref:TlpA family protein disulfide reductase n=1 Tax=Bacteroides sp. AN502(2024) TaxID=3160599 RepID=UPI003516A992
MKFRLLLLCILCSSFTLNKKTIQIKGIVNDEFTIDSQWIYWFFLIENECLVDSFFLEKGQQTFYFEKEMENDCFMSWITFEKKGPLQMELILEPEEHVTVYATSETSRFPLTVGSIGTMEQYKYVKERKWLNQKIEQLGSALINMKDSAIYKNIMDSIQYYTEFRAIGHQLQFLKETKSAQNYCTKLLVMRDDNTIPKELLDSLENVMLKRFPDSESVKQYFSSSIPAPATEKGEAVFQRYREIIQRRTKSFKSFYSPTKEFLSNNKSPHYVLGNKVTDIELKDINGKSQRLFDIKEKYILIDFWASWCAPCCKSYPELLEVRTKYKDSLNIYAISIDEKYTLWEKAVGRLDPEQLFIHVNAIPGTTEANMLKDLFGITRLPANFLLDEDRKIIAVDLRGEDLKRTVNELMNSKCCE